MKKNIYRLFAGLRSGFCSEKFRASAVLCTVAAVCLAVAAGYFTLRMLSPAPPAANRPQPQATLCLAPPIETCDVLYENGVRYMPNKSFLNGKPGYDTLMLLEVNVVIASSPSGVGRVIGPREKSYSAVWHIVHDSLFLVGLDYPHDRTTPEVGCLNGMAYKKMERFLGLKFSDRDPSKKKLTETQKILSAGAIFASWVDGDYFRQKALAPDENFWAGQSCEKIVFRHGIKVAPKTRSDRP